MVGTLSVSAAIFVGDRPHFITWTVEGSGRTWCAYHPKDRLPFGLSKTFGSVDRNNVFRASKIEDIYLDGLKVVTVVIQPDVPPSDNESPADTVRTTETHESRQQSESSRGMALLLVLDPDVVGDPPPAEFFRTQYSPPKSTMRNSDTPQEIRTLDPEAENHHRIVLSMPRVGKLHRALLARRTDLQYAENNAAKAEKRQAREITIHEVILRHCCEVEGLHCTE